MLLMQLQKFSSPVRKAWGNVLVNVVFGAWFGRVLLQTGIADALIRKAVELGGDKPVIICVLLSTVTTAIFSTLFGAGAVVAIGVIILPILMSLGHSEDTFHRILHDECRSRNVFKPGTYRTVPGILPWRRWKTADHL